MKLSAKTRYAARILFCMARNGVSHPVSSTWLSTHTGITSQFIEQIMQKLRTAGITNSVRGARGGHILVKQPKEVTIGTILTVMEGGIELSSCLGGSDSCDRCRKCAMYEVWTELNKNFSAMVNSITIADVVNGSCPDQFC